MYVELK